MADTLRQTINHVMRKHLSQGYLAFGQCLTAVGWVNGTIPELDEKCGLVELPMSDVMNSGIVVGAALMGKRPMYVVRYQGFQWLNSTFIANYAAKSKELWQTACPVFVRSLAMEGGIGPVAGSSHHGIFYRMPGIKIVAPMTPNEFLDAYDVFMAGDDPMYVSEHRRSFDNAQDFMDVMYPDNVQVTVFAYSISRMEMSKLHTILEERGIRANIFHQHWIRPSAISDHEIDALSKSVFGIVVDDDYPNGIAKQIAADLMVKSGTRVYAIGLEERTAGAAKRFDNLPPTAEKIADYIQNQWKDKPYVRRYEQSV